MWVVGAPHEGVDAVDVAPTQLDLAHRRCTDEDVLADVLRRQPLDEALGAGTHLLHLPVGATEHHVGFPEEVAEPPRPALDRHVLEVRVLVELPREQELPQRTVGPEGDLEHVLGHVLVVRLGVGLTRMGVHDKTGLVAGLPDRVVLLVTVRLGVVPHRRDHDPLDAGLVGEGVDLLHRLLDTMGDRHEGHTRAARWIRRAELLEPAVVGSGAGPGQLRVGDGTGMQAGTERRRLHAGHGVAVGEDHLAGDAVGIECLVADLGVVGALKAPFVLPLPLLDILAVHLLDHRPVFVAGLEPLVELCVYGALEVGAVVLDIEAGVGVGTDDDVRVVRLVDAFERVRHVFPFGSPLPGLARCSSLTPEVFQNDELHARRGHDRNRHDVR